MTTLENNKLIAEFMGIVFTKDNKANHPRIKAPYPPIECFNYHLDWNWLIEVVEKIERLEDLERFEITNFSINITYYESREIKFIYNSHHTNNGKYLMHEKSFSTKIEAVYNACVEFIKWYNEQKEV